MKAFKIMAIIMIVAGIAAILSGKFSYTKNTRDIKLGALEMSVSGQQTVNMPVWSGLAIAIGGGVLLYAAKNK